MLVFNYPEEAVTVYREGTAEPEKYTELFAAGDYLTEFYEEVVSDKRDMTENIFASTRYALLLQAEADKEYSL
jgi:hypothetical protein